MAATDTVIVDIPSLENAISAFKQCSNKIGANASDLQSNAGEICSAWTSAASDTYRLKIENLVKNVQSAQTALQSADGAVLLFPRNTCCPSALYTA